MHTHFTRDDRVTLSALLRADLSQAECARQLGVHKSTITREVRRAGNRYNYSVREAHADSKRKRRASKHKTRILNDKKLKVYIIRRIKKRASPDSIAGRWKYMYGAELSHQTIYNWIKSEKKDLIQYLPQQGRRRRAYGTKILKSPYQQAKRCIIEKDTGAKVYFAHPGCPYERPLNEHTNGLLRRFFSKKSRFANIKQKDVGRKVCFLNNYPRKSLGYRTPYEVYRERCISN